MRRIFSVFIGIAILFGCTLYYFPQYLPKVLLPASQKVQYWVKEMEQHIWPEPEQSPDALSYDVIRAIDGDTLLISMSGIETTVRLIGIDAPESVHPDEKKNTAEGRQVSQWLKQYIEGKRVTLEYDQELNDQYGRTLAYVFVDNVMLEDVLLTMGMARTLTMEPNIRYQHHFEMAEKDARDSGSGFWGTGFFVK